MADRITVDRKRTLETPIERAGGDYTVTRRELVRIHPSNEGFTRYYQEANGEVSEYLEWTEATKAAVQVLMDDPTPERL